MTDYTSRQEAIDALDQIFDRCEEIEAHLPEGDPDRIGYKMYPDYITVWKYLHQLPSTEPERRTGHWIRHPEQTNIYGGKCVECSECGEKYMVSYIEDEKFCRNCGAKMEVADGK